MNRDAVRERTRVLDVQGMADDDEESVARRCCDLAFAAFSEGAQPRAWEAAHLLMAFGNLRARRFEQVMARLGKSLSVPDDEAPALAGLGAGHSMEDLAKNYHAVLQTLG